MTTATEVRDPLDGDWDPNAYWSTSNVGEAVPGVLTPLNWSLWQESSEGGLRIALVATGALPRRELVVPANERERILGLFHGRLGANVDFMGRFGDKLPGTSGAAVAEQLLGRLPDDFVSEPTLRRLPFVAVTLPRSVIRSPRAVRKLAAETASWWSAQVARSPTLSFQAASDQFALAQREFRRSMGIHVTCVMAAIQPLYDVIGRLSKRVGSPDLTQRLLTGHGNHAEVEVVEDLWAVSRDRLGLDAFLARHGYHGPDEGEISAYVWRERPEPVGALIEQYRRKPESENPDAVHERRAEERRTAERELLAGVPGATRPAVRGLLWHAARVVPLRGVGKVSYVQCVDVGRAAGRRLGQHLAEAGSIDDPDDVFMLTIEEVRSSWPDRDMRELVSARREQRARNLEVVLPMGWRGRPEVSVAKAEDGQRDGLRLEGIGASPGVVEGRARVLLEADLDKIEPGEILVAPYTDPSWGPIMFASTGLVVDIGGELSHAAVVARELGVPCVMSTGDGTRRLRTGDLCRVDGAAGTVELLEEGS